MEATDIPVPSAVLAAEANDRLADLDRFGPLMEKTAARLEVDPSAWTLLWEEPAFRAIACLGLPDDVNPHPFGEAGFGVERCGYALHLQIVERLSRHGASALMALPSSALPTSVILKLGTADQIARFFAPFRGGPAFTFFAITEPARGSDAGAVETRLSRDGDDFVLNGRKTLIGGAGSAGIGLVFARLDAGDDGPSRLVLVMVDAAQPGVRATPLPASGLAGAGLFDIRFDRVAIASHAILGPEDRVPALLALMTVFERHRPMVAAMALGTGRALASYADAGRAALLNAEAAVLSRRMDLIGKAGERGAIDGAEISQFKRLAVAFAWRARRAAAAGRSGLAAQDGRLARLMRDVCAFEYMEGASNIHRLAAARCYRPAKGRTVHVS